MKIVFSSVGKAHDPLLKSAIDDFTKRISRYFKVEWNIISPPRNASAFSEQELKRKEGEIILSAIGKEDFLVALDEKGETFTSLKLAAFLQQRANESAKQMIFLIGGAYGIDEAVLKRANHKWSLSNLTFPHQLVRIILAEQIYRACTILKNEKYHHQ